jgi:hypothetical protein
MPRLRLLGPLALAALSTAFAGCSFAFVNGPPPDHHTSPFFTCTSGKGVPMLDTVAATLVLLDGVGFATESGSDGNTATGSRTGNAIVLGAGAALLAASAAYGYKKTSECSEAEMDLLRRTPVFTGASGPFAPQGPPGPQRPYDPWVAQTPVVPVAPLAPAVPGASPAVAPPAATGPATGPSPWDGPSPGK